MVLMRDLNDPLPKELMTPAEFVVNQDLCSLIRSETLNIARLKDLTDEAARLSLSLDKTTLRYESSLKINRLMEQLQESPDDIERLKTIESALKILGGLVPDLNLQTAQNVFFRVAKEWYPEEKKRKESGDDQARQWMEQFGLIAEHLGLVIE